MFDATGIILAGGRSSRIGRNKAFLEVSGRRIIDREIDVLNRIFKEVVIVCKNVEEYQDYSLRIERDLVDYLSPLSGIYTGLKISLTEKVLIVACDMPFLNQDVINYQMELSDGYDVVVPYAKGKFEPLHAVYSKNCIPAIEEMFRRENFRIYDFYSNVRTRVVKEEELMRIDSQGVGFINVNTQDELNRLNN